jgi:hypothetical protein
MCDCEPNDFQTSWLRTARKDHRCCECPAGIAAGDLYEVTAVGFDGRASQFKTCLPCAEVRIQLQHDERLDCDCIQFGELQSELHEAEQWL